MRSVAKPLPPTLVVAFLLALTGCGQGVRQVAPEATGAPLAPVTVPSSTAPAPADPPTGMARPQVNLPFLLPRHLPGTLTLTAAVIAFPVGDGPVDAAANPPPPSVTESGRSAADEGPSTLAPSTDLVTESSDPSRGSSDPSDQGWQLTAADDHMTVTISVGSGDAATVDATAAFQAGSHTGITVDEVTVRSTRAHLVRYSDTPSATLLWFGFGAMVTISGDVGGDELIVIAEGLEQVDATAWHVVVDPILDIEITGSGSWSGDDWSLSIGRDSQSWCGDVLTDTIELAACEPTDTGRDVRTIWLIEPAPDEAGLVDVRLFGATTLPVVAVELRDANGDVLATSELSAADLAPYRVFAMWPEGVVDVDAAATYDVVLVDDAGNVLAHHRLTAADLVDSPTTTDPTDPCADPVTAATSETGMLDCLFSQS